ncbi:MULTISPECIES: HAD family hydrolase [unclassified Micromonospora]|uniref:HAD family hydrolase n=1 Tax=unclassified Micromonospora TaxID=2617518 RepID=UPI00188E6C2C|nr:MULTISPECIES: HAD family hydrolase [unclassified Micromonospora]MBF5032599.1 HAD hydrolase-like protein [Micromonospora sp. ANENR4]WBC01717.1 HAD hydrolase-like protein [Micromonospora sp. WMMA1976]
MAAKPVTTVLFDFAWTLFARDSERWVGNAAASIGRTLAVGEEHRIAGDFAELLRKTATDPAHIARDLDPRVWDRAILTVLEQIPGVDRALASVMHETHAEAIEPYADTVATLSALRDSGVRIGVVSNVGWDIRKCFARHGLDGHVDAFVLSYEVGFVKPDPRIWGVALEALHAVPGQTLMVGDHPTGDGGSVAAGIPALILPMVESPTQKRGFEHVLRLAQVAS